MIKLTCPKCEAELTYGDDLRGGAARCYYCKALITLPEELEIEITEPETITPILPDRKAETAELTSIMEISSATHTLFGTMIATRPRRKRRRHGAYLAVTSLMVGTAALILAVVVSVTRDTSEPTPSTAMASNPIVPLPTPSVTGPTRRPVLGEPIRINLYRFETANTSMKVFWETMKSRLACESGGKVSFDAVIPQDGEYEIAVTAAGSEALGIWPRFTVLFNDEKLTQHEIDSPAPTVFKYRKHLASGKHALAICFDNDYFDKLKDLDRNLYLYAILLRPLQ